MSRCAADQGKGGAGSRHFHRDRTTTKGGQNQAMEEEEVTLYLEGINKSGHYFL